MSENFLFNVLDAIFVSSKGRKISKMFSFLHHLQKQLKIATFKLMDSDLVDFLKNEMITIIFYKHQKLEGGIFQVKFGKSRRVFSFSSHLQKS